MPKLLKNNLLRQFALCFFATLLFLQGLCVSAQTHLSTLLPAKLIASKVTSGRIVFKLKKGLQLPRAPKYFRGNINLVFSKWQNIAAVQNEMLAAMATGQNSRRGPINRKTKGIKLSTYQFTLKTEKRLACTYAQTVGRKHRLYLDICYRLEKNKDYRKWAEDMLTKLSKAKFSTTFWQRHRGFSQFDLRQLTLPTGFLPVGSNGNKTYFVDSSGMVEVEVFSELSEGLKSSKVANDLYDKSIIKLVEQQGPWRLQTISSQKKNRCLLFDGRHQEQTNFCYTLVKTKRGRTYRLVLLSKYNKKYIKRSIVQMQTTILKEWQRLIKK